jgi:hypothetical protein
MPELRSTEEDPIQIHDGLNFVTKQDISPGETATPAYTIEGTDQYVIGIEKNTLFAPEFYDTNGVKIDESTRIIVQKTDPQENPLGNAIAFSANFGQFNYEKFRSDPEFYKTTTKSLLIDEREYVHIYLDIPSSAASFDASASRLTIGDPVTQTAKPVFIRKKDTLSGAQKQAAKQANAANQR